MSCQTHFSMRIWMWRLNLRYLSSMRESRVTNWRSSLSPRDMGLYCQNYADLLLPLLLISKRIQMNLIQQQAMPYVDQINEILGIEEDQQDLFSRKWYLAVLEKFYELDDDIKDEPDQVAAIAKLLEWMDEHEQLEQKVAQCIDPVQIVKGDPQNIVYMVKAVVAFAREELGLEEQSEEQDGEQEQFLEIASKPIEREERGKRSLSSDGANRIHSAQGISNEFEEDEDDSEINSPQDMQQHNYPQMVESIKPDKLHNFNHGHKVAPFHQDSEADQFNLDEDSPHYLQQKLSETKMKRKDYISPAAKSKKKIPQYQQLSSGQKKQKTLVKHPRTPMVLKSAKSPEQIEMTHKVQEQIKKTKKKAKPAEEPVRRMKSAANLHLEKKSREVQYVVQEKAAESKRIAALKKQQRSSAKKSDAKITKILNWREEQMKRERKEYEQSIKMKVQLQREMYVRQINDLIVRLQKEKSLQEKRDFQQNLVKENEQAVKRMTALDQWYKDKINLIQDNRKQKRKDRQLIRTGHKEIVGNIERDLKRENEEKLMRLAKKYRNEQDMIQTDLEELTKKIIKVYKKN